MIRLENISKKYRGDGLSFQALKGVNLEIKKGEFVKIIGPSGSGKTTLLNIIGLLDCFDSGLYLFEGQNFSALRPNLASDIRLSKFGYIFQHFYLLNHLTALENVEMPLGYKGVSPAKRRARAMELLRKVGLGNKLDNKPTQLSGGEQQRVAIARSLINSPELLLADEPTGNLDSVSSEMILNLLKEINQEGVTIALVTHDPMLISHAGRTCKIFDGVLSEGI